MAETKNEGNFYMFKVTISSLDLNNSTIGWYLDSWATNHASENHDNFISVKKYSGNVRIAGGQSHSIIGCGIVYFIPPSREIKDLYVILCVLRLKMNLLSIGSFIDMK